MKKILLFAIVVLMFSCGEPKEYDMTVGDYLDRLEYIRKEADEIFESQTTALFSLEDTTGRTEKYAKYLEEKKERLKEKRVLSEEELNLLKNASDRINFIKLKSMTVREALESQRQVEGK